MGGGNRVQAQQSRPGGRRCQRARDAGRAVHTRQFGCHERASDLGAKLVAHDDRGDQVGALAGGALRQGEHGGDHGNTQVADAGGVHVFAHQAVPHHGIGKGGIGG